MWKHYDRGTLRFCFIHVAISLYKITIQLRIYNYRKCDITRVLTHPQSQRSVGMDSGRDQHSDVIAIAQADGAVRGIWHVRVLRRQVTVNMHGAINHSYVQVMSSVSIAVSQERTTVWVHVARHTSPVKREM